MPGLFWARTTLSPTPWRWPFACAAGRAKGEGLEGVLGLGLGDFRKKCEGLKGIELAIYMKFHGFNMVELPIQFDGNMAFVVD